MLLAVMAVLACVAIGAGFGAEPATAQGLPLPELPGEVPGDGGGSGGAGPVGVKVTPPSRPALARTIPITRRRGAHPVSVTSLPLRRIGPLRQGTRLEAGGELQVTVCLRRSLGGHRNGEGCAGRIYGYDPRIRAQLVLAPGPRAARPSKTVPIGGARTVTCTQRQPDRNHHCAITIDWRGIALGEGGARLPECAPSRCRVNLVASASSPHARKRERVAVGGFEGDGRVDNRGESRISAIRYSPGISLPAPLRDRTARLRRLPLVPDGDGIGLRSVYSVAIPRPRPGEELRIAGRYLGALGRLPYNARTRTQLILADDPRAIKPGPHARRVAGTPVYLAQESNFNCTRGRSAHRTPCPVSKIGVTKFERGSARPVFVNLLAGHGAIGFEARRHKRNHRIHVRRGGYMKVWRFGSKR